MDTMLYTNDLQLGRFAEYLLKQKLVPEKNAPYYVSWVRKFLARGVTEPVAALDERVAEFLHGMETTGNYQDWQITQAERALRLYFVNFKGDKDRSTILAESVKEPLRDHLGRVKALHEQDLAAGVGEVWLPGALAIKYPKAPKEWGWQYVFPSKQDYLGHANVETTMIYTHVVKGLRAPARSPLDMLKTE